MTIHVDASTLAKFILCIVALTVLITMSLQTDAQAPPAEPAVAGTER